MLPRQYLPITGICHTNQLSGSEYEPACYGDIHHLASESLHNRNHRIYLQKMQVNIRSSMTLAPYVRKHRPWITSSQLYLLSTCDHLPRSEEHTSELQSLMRISHAVFSLNKNTHTITYYNTQNTTPT